MEEILDIIDFSTGRPTGEQAPRKLAHKNALAHKAVHLWVRIRHEGVPCFLFQQRSLDKPNFPGIYVASVGGHVMAGEGFECLIREAEEEIGLEVELAQVQYIESHPFILELPDYHDYEWIDEYLLDSDLSIRDFSFPDREAIGLALIPQTEIAPMIQDPGGYVIEGWHWDGERIEKRGYGGLDFIPDFWDMSITHRLAVL